MLTNGINTNPAIDRGLSHADRVSPGGGLIAEAADLFTPYSPAAPSGAFTGAALKP
jgi:hypothetical protein